MYFAQQEEKKYALTPLPNPTQKGNSNSSTRKCSNIFPLKYDWPPRIYFDPPRRPLFYGYPSHELIHMTFNQSGRMPFATATYKYERKRQRRNNYGYFFFSFYFSIKFCSSLPGTCRGHPRSFCVCCFLWSYFGR